MDFGALKRSPILKAKLEGEKVVPGTPEESRNMGRAALNRG